MFVYRRIQLPFIIFQLKIIKYILSIAANWVPYGVHIYPIGNKLTCHTNIGVQYVTNEYQKLCLENNCHGQIS